MSCMGKQDLLYLLDEQLQNYLTESMALRVLLADESSTIKKVFQLALQDYAVDVRPVNVGVDVHTVAQKFKPDIIFADVLLQKKNGYDVAAELKQDPSLQAIPIVLMWSGFMELDEDKLQASHADAKLEKPFDVAALRKLVAELVPRTKDQRLSQFLSFPKMPEIEEPKPAQVEEAAPQADEDFQQVPIPKMKGTQDKFRVNLKPEELAGDDLPVAFDSTNTGDVEDLLGGADDEEFAIRESTKKPTPGVTAKARSNVAVPEIAPLDPSDELEVEMPVSQPAIPSPAKASASAVPALTEAQLEKIIRAQSAEIIESVVWKVIPDLAAQIIERELNKLLKEKDANPY
jgi:two-component system cell cycle response regulator